MKALKPQHEGLLNILKGFPQGAFPRQLLAADGRISKQQLNYYLSYLIRKGFIEKRGNLYFSKPFTALVGGTKPFTQQYQRPHAIRAAIKPYPSNWPRLEATLETLGISYKRELKGNLARLSWQGREIRITSKCIYTIQELKEAPMQIPMEAVLKKAAAEATPYFEQFLAKTGFRAHRTRLGALLVEISYWENGYPGNEIAEESLKDKTRIVYAYNAKGGQAAWADSSLGSLKELETNSERIDSEMKEMLGAIETGEISPYDDELRTRNDIAELTGIVKGQAENLAFFAREIRTHVNWMYNFLRASSENRPLPKPPKPMPQAQRRL